MKNKILLIMLLGLFMISFASAMTCDGTVLTGSPFKQGNSIELKQVCDTCTYVTLSSISYPDSSSVYININMTKNGVDYNYSFNDTNLNGQYGYSVLGDKDGSIATENFCFDVNLNGEDTPINQSLMIIGLIAIIGLFIILGFSFRIEKWKVRGFFFMCASLMGVITLNSIRIIASSSENLGTMMETGLVLGIIVLLFLFLYFFIYALIEVFSYFRKNKQKTWDFRP